MKKRIIKKLILILKWLTATRFRRVVSAITIISLIAGPLSYIVFKPQPTAASWWNDSWAYRKPISITNASGGELTDFQVLALSAVNLSTDITNGKIQSDLDDLRFTDVNGDVLPYWIEDATATTAVNAWIKMTVIPISGATIYMYYGNPSAASAANGRDVFEAFDDFNDNSIDSAWSTEDADITSGTSFNETTQQMQIDADGTDTWTGNDEYGSVYRSINGDFIAVVKVVSQEVSNAWAKAGLMVKNDMSAEHSSTGYAFMTVTPSNGWSFQYDSNNNGYLETHSTAGVSAYPTYIKLAKSGTTLTGYYSSDGTIWTQGGTAAISSVQSVQDIGMSATSHSAGVLGLAVFDNFYVYKYASTAPAAAAPSTEEKGLAPIAYWSLDDGQGTNAQDGTVNNNDGTLTNMSSTASSTSGWQTEDNCVAGKCLAFDGSNDHIGGFGDKYDMRTNNQTISVWFKGGTLSQDGVIIQKSRYNLGAGRWSMKITTAGKIGVFMNCGGSDIDSIGTNSKVVTDNIWHNITGVWNRSGNFVTYVDGVADGVVDISSCNGVDMDNPYYFLIGTYGDSTGTGGIQTTLSLKGSLDEPKIYNYARSAAQIKMDYNVGLAGMSGASAGDGAAVAMGGKSAKWMSDGLVGYWKMDETAGSWDSDTVADDAIDWSGNGNTGSAYGDADAAAGKFGNGGTFDGTGDYVTLSNPWSNTPTAYSVCAWVKPTNTTGNLYITNWRENSTTDIWFQLDRNGTSYRFYVGDGTNLGEVSVSGAVAGTWAYLCGVRNNNTLTLYLDGVLSGTDSSKTFGAIGTVVDFVIGAESDSHGSPWNGSIDETRVYNRALSAKEVSDLYNYAPGPVAHYTFEEGSGQYAYDTSGYGNNGTLGANATPSTDDPTYATGKIGKALSFDGTSDYAALPNLGVSGSSPRSVSVWINPATASGERTIVGWGAANTGLQNMVNYNVHTKDIYVSFVGNDWYTGNNAAPLNTWTHVSMVYDGGVTSASTIHVYINGIAQSLTNAGTPAALNTTNASYAIGKSLLDAGREFNGSIDDVKIYNYARSQKQIMEDMAGSAPDGVAVAKAVSATGKTNVAYYKFDEGYGTTAYDASLNKINGVISGFLASSTPNGKFGRALSLNGSSGVVTVTNATAIDLNDNLADGFTVSTWVNPTSAGEANNGQIFWKGAGNYLRVGNLSGGRLDVGAGIDLATTDATATTTSAIPVGAWSQITMTYATSTHQVQIYINGVLKTTSSAGVGVFSADANNLLIGGTTTNNFDGLIDEFKIYNFALTADEIKLDYNKGSSIKLGSFSQSSTGVASSSAASIYCVPGSTDACSPPVGEWKFEEGSGQYAYDTSGNGNDGTLGSGATADSADPTYATGKIGKALQFDGSNDYVVGPITSFVDSQDDAHSVFAWIYPHSTSATQGIWSFGEYNDTNYNVGLGISSNQLIWLRNGTDLPVGSGLTVPANQWSFVGYSHSASYTTFFVNNSSARISNGYGSLVQTDPHLIGATARNGGVEGFFDGVIDQLRVYNYARTAAQIAWEYNQGKPIAHWKMDECQGGTIHDSSGNNNSGTLYIGTGGTQTATGTCATAGTMWGNGASGKRNASLNFDGTDDYVSMGAITAGLSNSFTFSAWLYNTVSGGAAVKNAVASQVASYSNYWAIIGTYQNKWNFALYDGTNNPVAYSDNNFSLNTWTHIVGVRDTVADKLYIYKDGVLQGDGTTDTTTSVPSYSAFNIGAQTTQSSRYFAGQIDDVQIYNYALTATQVKNLYTGGAVRFGQ